MSRPRTLSKIPRVAIGMPLYNNADFLSDTLEGISSQTLGDFRVVMVDDRSTDQTARMAGAFAARDGRFLLAACDEHVGLIDNWRRAFTRTMTMWPEAPYFAWASGHDMWKERFLEVLLAELDEHEALLGAFPLGDWHASRPGPPRLLPRSGETFGLEDPIDRLATRVSGRAIHGVFRPDALRRAGVKRGVVWPDRLLMAEMSLDGELRQVPEVLWTRRETVRQSRAQELRRQRQRVFTGPAPWHAWVAPEIVHSGVLFALVASGRAGPAVARRRALAAAAAYLRGDYGYGKRTRSLRKRWSRMRKRLRRGAPSWRQVVLTLRRARRRALRRIGALVSS